MNIGEFFRDQFWQSVSVFAGALAAGIKYFRDRRRKILSWEIVSSTRLPISPRQPGNELAIYYNGEPIDKAHILILRVINSGNVDIKPKDFNIPISFRINNVEKLLHAKVLSTAPHDFSQGVQIDIAQNLPELSIKNPLLNRRNSIDLQILLSKSDDKEIQYNDIKPNAHILGLDEFARLKNHNNKRGNALSYLIVCAGIAVTLIFGILAEVFDLNFNTISWTVAGSILIFVGLLSAKKPWFTLRK